MTSVLAAGPSSALVATALAAAVLVWPVRRSSRSTRAAADIFAVDHPRGRLQTDGGIFADAPAESSRAAQIWRADPAVVWRRWRARRRPTDLEAEALVLLDACVPALQAGLTPVMALRLAASGTPSLSAGSSSQLRQLLVDTESVEATGAPSSLVWVSLAARSGSAPIKFVAGAWRLSETTGAPLVVAAERAATGLRDMQSRRRRVAVAVAGPRATVLVLTVLPLTGPLFGLVCGLSPAQLYLGSPPATASVAVGLLLAGLGRVWCRRLIRSALGP